jgi:cation:H+ antiporter
VFVIAGGAMSGLPLDGRQREELFLTAAQSAFAVAVLMSRSISVREAWALFGLFIAQFVLGGVLPAEIREWERLVVAIIYLVLTAIMLVRQRHAVRPLLRDAFRTPVRELAHSPAGADPPTPGADA